MRDPVIEVSGVSKVFTINTEGKRSFKQTFIDFVKHTKRKPLKEIKIFNNVSFSIGKGEVFGIIGENGAGKSTSMKMLAGIIQPDEGEIKTKGVVAALLEIGLAFHPDLTGIENARLYGSVLGVSRKKMMELIPDIFSFAELEGYEYVPLKKYSSGMQVRLAFAVATVIDPDILLLDEVFSVGDQNFQEKSFNKIHRFIQEGKTVLLVSHDLGVIEKVCTRVMFVEKSGNVHIGTPKEMVQLYHGKLNHKGEYENVGI